MHNVSKELNRIYYPIQVQCLPKLATIKLQMMHSVVHLQQTLLMLMFQCIQDVSLLELEIFAVHKHFSFKLSARTHIVKQLSEIYLYQLCVKDALKQYMHMQYQVVLSGALHVVVSNDGFYTALLFFLLIFFWYIKRLYKLFIQYIYTVFIISTFLHLNVSAMVLEIYNFLKNNNIYISHKTNTNSISMF